MSGKGSGDQYKEALFERADRLYEQISSNQAVSPKTYRDFQAAVKELEVNGWLDEWKAARGE